MKAIVNNVANVYCAAINCSNMSCNKNINNLASMAIGDEVVLKNFQKTCPTYTVNSSKDAASENKCGTWIMRGGKRYCSVCGDRACVTRDADDFWYTVGTKFCPSCGAKMDTN